MTARSHSATDAMTFATSRPPGVLVSTPRSRATKAAPLSIKSGEELGEVADAAGRPVEACNYESIDLPVVDHREDPLELRPVERPPGSRVLQVGDVRPAPKGDRRDGRPPVCAASPSPDDACSAVETLPYETAFTGAPRPG